MAHVDRLFGNKNLNFQNFCWIISKHIKFSKDISLEWCLISDFADAESISTTGWQSAQYVAFSCLSLVYFGSLEDFKNNFDKNLSKHFDISLFFGSSSFRLSFWKIFVIRTLLMITLGYFYPLMFAMGCQLKKYQIPFTQKGEKRGKAAFFKDTSNCSSLLNLKSLIKRFGSLRNLWAGEWEKIIKYIKAEMNTICDSETYMPCVLNSLLCTHCLNNLMKDNQH